jgi:YVTN family beta-propeller protein
MLVHLRRCSTGDSMVCPNPRSPAILNVGKDLGGLDVHPDNFYGIVASKGTNELVIVDTHYDRETWNQVVGFVHGLPAGSNPNAVAFSHKGDRAYSLNSNGIVSKIDTSGAINTWKVMGTISVGKDPKAMAFSELDLHAYVTNSGDGTVSVIRLSDFTLVDTVKVGDNPQDIFINLGERVAAYVVNTGSDTISIIDDQPQNPTFNKVLDTVKLPPGSKPVGIILTEP